MNIREILEKKHSITLLLKINECPGIMQKDLIEADQTGRTSKITRIKELIDLGLIEEKKSTKDWTALTYNLTEEGERITKLLMMIENGEKAPGERNHNGTLEENGCEVRQ